MTIDLESRLHHYGDDLDAVPEVPSASIRSRASRARRPSPVVRGAVAAAVVAVATSAGAVLIAQRGTPSTDRTSSAPDSTDEVPTDFSLVYGPGDWRFVPREEFAPVTLADGVVPWYVLDDEAAGEFDVMDPGLGGSLHSIVTACADWAMAGNGIECNALEGAYNRPAVTYGDDAGRAVALFTSHADIDPNSYVIELSYARGYDLQSATVFEESAVGDSPAWYQVIGDDSQGSTRLLAWRPSPGALVAIEATGLSHDELFELATHVEATPVDEVPPLPLVLANPYADEFNSPWAIGRLVGAVVDGQVCALPADHLLSDLDDCVALGHDPMLFTSSGPGRYAGLVSADVASIRLDFADGSIVTIVPKPQPVGDVRAFAMTLSGPRATTITALDADGNDLMAVDLAESLVPPTTTGTTTSSPSTTASGEV